MDAQLSLERHLLRAIDEIRATQGGVSVEETGPGGGDARGGEDLREEAGQDGDIDEARGEAEGGERVVDLAWVRANERKKQTAFESKQKEGGRKTAHEQHHHKEPPVRTDRSLQHAHAPSKGSPPLFHTPTAADQATAARAWPVNASRSPRPESQV